MSKKKYSVNWIEDHAAIAVIDDIGLESYESDIAQDQVDKKASAENRARDVPLDADRVTGIKIAMRQGKPIPKIVVRKSGGKYVIAGGNHRFNAMAGRHEFPAYVIECTDAEFETLCRTLNTVVGQGSTKSERIAHAADAVERLGMTVTDAAKLYQISKSSITDSIRISKVERKLVAAGVKTSKIRRGALSAIHGMSKNENVFRAAARFLSDTNVPVSDFINTVNEAKACPTEAQSVAVFEKNAKLHSGKSRAVPRPKRKTFLMMIGGILAIQERSLSDLEFTESEEKEVRERCQKVINLLKCLCEANGQN